MSLKVNLRLFRLGLVMLLAGGIAAFATGAPGPASGNQDETAAGSDFDAGTHPRAMALLPRTFSASPLRVIDGDTIEVRVPIWLGQDVVTKVRLAGIDAPELHTRCASEKIRGAEAKAALEKLVGSGPVMLSGVRIDKYGGRVLARVSSPDGQDIEDAMVRGGYATPYHGGKRNRTCA